MRAILFVGPSATGKTFAIEMLVKHYPHAFEPAKLYTTRAPRKEGKATDRIFVSDKEFQTKVANGDFLAYGEFGGNYYGYTKESLIPTTKNLLLNTWPAFLPTLSKFPELLIVGMQAPEDWRELLTKRLQSRGETPETMQKRLSLIEHDIQITEQYRELIEDRGRLFTISDDTTVPENIIPWIFRSLDLQT